jgi:hypothetical protein
MIAAENTLEALEQTKTREYELIARGIAEAVDVCYRNGFEAAGRCLLKELVQHKKAIGQA